MQRHSDDDKYFIEKDRDLWGVTFKCASSSLRRAHLPRVWTELRKGDHVRIIVRDPRDRLVSAWKWFTTANMSYMPDILEANREDHDRILHKSTKFAPWVNTALKYWNPHWVPQTEIHPRWREFELVNIADLHTKDWGHEKQTRKDNTWEQYYDEATLALVNKVFEEDLEMWKEIKDGINTGTKRLLR